MFKLLLIPIITVILVQLLKLFFEASKNKFTWKTLTSYGGMPSSHSAIVASLATITFITSGVSSINFVITVILSLIVIRDAVGLRQYVSNHAKILNNLIKDLPDRKEFKYPYVNEKVGHTVPEVLVGLILGILFSLILNIII